MNLSREIYCPFHGVVLFFACVDGHYYRCHLYVGIGSPRNSRVDISMVHYISTLPRVISVGENGHIGAPTITDVQSVSC